MKLLIIQPSLFHYRRLIYNNLCKTFDVTVVASSADTSIDEKFAFKLLPLKSFYGIKWQYGAVSHFIKKRYNAIWIAADIHYLSSLILTILAKLFGATVVIHGQGLYKRSKYKILRKIAVQIWILMCDKYISYATVCTNSLAGIWWGKSKVVSLNNRFETSNALNVVRMLQIDGRDLMFIGRLREGCGISSFLDSLKAHNNSSSSKIKIHIVGVGDEFKRLKKIHSSNSVIFYGEITEWRKLYEIAKQCSLGIYPGAAGLSVLTYMGLGLAPVVGDSLEGHMGPEPSYVINEENGFLFKMNDMRSLMEVILTAINHPNLKRIRQNAYKFQSELHSIRYSTEMAGIIFNCKLK